MIYAVRDLEGRLTGATYDQASAAAVTHHAAFGETLMVVAGIAPTTEGDGWAEVLGDLPTARAVALTRMRDWIDQFTARFTAGIPAAELASWPVKAMAARAHLAGDPQPMIEAEAALRGIPATELAQKIAAKAEQLAGVAARVAGLRGATEAALAAAQTPEEVQAALIQSQETAMAMIHALGLEGADATL